MIDIKSYSIWSSHGSNCYNYRV